MTRVYRNNVVIKKLHSGRPYQRPCLNYIGVSKENVNYLELISKHILDSENFDLMVYECRKEFVLHEKTGYKPDTKSEKGLCRYWYYRGFDEKQLSQILGEPIEYELNLFGKRVNIDLVSYDKSTHTIHLIEAKGRVAKGDNKYSSPETLLRCALEIKTYFETLKQCKEVLIKQLLDKDKIDTSDVTLKLDVLVPKNDFFEEQMDDNRYPFLNNLLINIGVSVLFYEDFIRSY